MEGNVKENVREKTLPSQFIRNMVSGSLEIIKYP